MSILPYEINKAEIDKQDIDEAKAAFRNLTAELNERQVIKNILLVQTMTAAWSEYELKRLSRKGEEICIKEIRELLKTKLPKLFSSEETIKRL